MHGDVRKTLRDRRLALAASSKSICFLTIQGNVISAKHRLDGRGNLFQ